MKIELVQFITNNSENHTRGFRMYKELNSKFIPREGELINDSAFNDPAFKDHKARPVKTVVYNFEEDLCCVNLIELQSEEHTIEDLKNIKENMEIQGWKCNN